jgi:DNA invertase Pin-like site-specific DNA recombinase
MSKPTAYSYVRFSTPEQGKGDSLRRQTEAAAEWCKKHKVHLDTATTLHDLGRSAFSGEHRKNADRCALAGFLRLVENGRVPRGSYLIIENLDRLSREHILAALSLLINLLQAGVKVVQLKPAETVFTEEANPYMLMLAIVELSRGHSESAMKSDRTKANWASKREQAAGGSGILTRRLPAWVVEVGGRLELDPAKAKVVRQIFDWAVLGWGSLRIVKRLTEEQVPPITGNKHWCRSYVAMVLADRRVLGEYLPKDKAGKVAGDVVRDYYPRVVSDDQFELVSGKAAKTKRKGGRLGRQVNLWAGLLFNARHGDKYFASVTASNAGNPRRILVTLGSKDGRHSAPSLPLDVFESALLARLKELDAHAILNGDSRPDESLALAAELARVEGRILELGEQLLDSGDVVTLATALRTLETRKRDLADQLAEARRAALHPLSETWGEAKALAATLKNDDDRTRLRSALRSLIKEIWMLVVPINGGSDRWCAVEVFFNTDDPKVQRRRDYLIHYRAGRCNGTVATSRCVSLANVIDRDDLDLRDRSHAAALEAELLALDLDELDWD